MNQPIPPAPTPPLRLQSRTVLKSYFRRGSLPTEQNFGDLIDSMVNQLDDGFAWSADQGLRLAASGTQQLAVFYPGAQQLQANRPAWLLTLDAPTPTGGAGGLSFRQPARGVPPRLHLHADGNVGIGTSTPAARLEVNGFIASQGRYGTYLDADPQVAGTQVPADGQWHRILTNLQGLQAFEIVAAAYGPQGRGRYAVAVATALGAFGRGQIFARNAWFWGWFQKIKFRWTGDLHGYSLEMRTASSFGEGALIVYHMTQLFDNRRPTPDS